MSESDEPILPDGEESEALASKSNTELKQQEVQSQPPETITDDGDIDEQTSSAPSLLPVQQLVRQLAATDEYNYVLMPHSDDPSAPKRRSKVGLRQSCQNQVVT